MNYKAIIFDLDGTLAYTLEDIGDAMNRTLDKYKYPLHDYLQYKSFIGHGLRELVISSLPENEKENSTIEICYNQLLNDYQINYLVKTKLYEGIEKLIEQLFKNDIKMAVYSNKDHTITVKMVEGLLGKNTFDYILGSKPELPLKPDKSGAMMLSRLLGIAPNEIAYVGDSDVDMQTANNAGMTAVGVSWGYRDQGILKNNGADIIIHSPLELFKII